MKFDCGDRAWIKTLWVECLITAIYPPEINTPFERCEIIYLDNNGVIQQLVIPMKFLTDDVPEED